MLQIIYLIIKTNNFRGDLSDISAKMASLVTVDLTYRSSTGYRDTFVHERHTYNDTFVELFVLMLMS